MKKLGAIYNGEGMIEPEKFIEEKVEWLKKTIGNEKAIVATSGGVDSMTTALLGHRAIDNRLKVIFLQDGLMRKGESEQVADNLRRIGITLETYDVKDEFFTALRGKVDPEEKRKAFRETFYRVFAGIVRELEAKVMRLERELDKAHTILDMQGKIAGLLGFSLKDGSDC